MTLVHTYDLTSHPGQEDALGGALDELSQAVKSIPGSQGAMVLRDRKDTNRFLFLEFWEDEASRKAAGSQLPKDVMGKIMGAVGGPIKMADFDRLSG